MAAARPLILIDALAYGPRDGGFTTAVVNLIHSCRQIQEFRFLVLHHSRHDADFELLGLPHRPVRFPAKLRFLASLFVLPGLARRLHADAVHCEISAFPSRAAVPGSVTAHDLYALIRPEVGGATLGKRAMTTLYWRGEFVRSLRRATFVKAISETTASDLRRMVGADLPVRVVLPRVAASSRVAERAGGLPGEPLRLLFLGSVVPRKNLPFLLLALLHVHRDWRLDVVGNQWWGMAAAAPLLADPRVSVHGYVSDARRERLLAACDVLVAPSLYEGFGSAAAEAMARGRLALTSDIPAFAEFVPDDCRFRLDDPRSLAALIDSLDATSYRRLLSLEEESVRRFSSERHVAAHRELFRELVAA